MTTNYPMTTVMATRTLTWTRQSGATTGVHVSIGTPQRRVFIETGRSDWYCPFQIVGLGDDSVKTGLGGDSLGALMSALRVCGAIVAASAPARAGALDYDELPGFGFPIIPELQAVLPARPARRPHHP